MTRPPRTPKQRVALPVLLLALVVLSGLYSWLVVATVSTVSSVLG